MRAGSTTCIAALLFLCAAPAMGAVIHVPAGHGTLQAALDAASPGDTILVAPDTYVENIDFLGKDVTLRSDADGDPATVDTAPETAIIDGNESGVVVTFGNGETAAAVLEGFTVRNGRTGISCLATSPTLRNNIVTGNYGTSGGGLYCEDASPAVSGCTFTGNNAGDMGGALYVGGGAPTFSDCAFVDNTAMGSPFGTLGGGLAFWDASPTLLRCTIRGNYAGGGGGIYLAGSFATMESCTISGNTADYPAMAWWTGGGILIAGGSSQPVVSLTNCLVTDNVSVSTAGGISCQDATLNLTHCTVARNSAGYGGGGLQYDGYAAVTVTNSILWGNTAIEGPEIYPSPEEADPNLDIVTVRYDMDGNPLWTARHDGPVGGDDGACSVIVDAAGNVTVTGQAAFDPYHVPVVTYSDVQGGWIGEGNVNANPLFADPDGADDLPGTADDDYRVPGISACVDAGDNAAPGLPAADLDGNPRVVDGDNDGTAVPDMGAYEVQPAPAWGAASTVSTDPRHARSVGTSRALGALLVLGIPVCVLLAARAAARRGRR